MSFRFVLRLVGFVLRLVRFVLCLVKFVLCRIKILKKNYTLNLSLLAKSTLTEIIWYRINYQHRKPCTLLRSAIIFLRVYKIGRRLSDILPVKKTLHTLKVCNTFFALTHGAHIRIGFIPEVNFWNLGLKKYEISQRLRMYVGKKSDAWRSYAIEIFLLA